MVEVKNKAGFCDNQRIKVVGSGSYAGELGIIMKVQLNGCCILLDSEEDGESEKFFLNGELEVAESLKGLLELVPPCFGNYKVGTKSCRVCAYREGCIKYEGR